MIFNRRSSLIPNATQIKGSRYSDYRLEGPASESRQGKEISSCSKKNLDRLLDAPSFLFSAYGGREVHHSPSSSADVKNGWNHTSDVPTCLNGVDRETSHLPL